MTDFFLYLIPWWVYAILGVVVALAVWRLIGSKAALAVLAALGALVVHRRGAQQGWKDRNQKEVQDAQKSIDKGRAARADADRINTDPERLRNTDGFRRD